jgi:hypothetical protein
MNVEIGTEALIFLFWEHLFQIFGILSLQCISRLLVCRSQEAHSYLHGVEYGEDGEGLRGVEVVAGQGHRQEGQVPSCSSKKIIKGLVLEKFFTFLSIYVKSNVLNISG